MSSTTEETASRAKLAKLVEAFQRLLGAEFIEAILQMEGDVNYAIPYSEKLKTINVSPGTILHQLKDSYGCMQEYAIPRIVEVLLRHGVDITRKNSKNQTALHASIEHCFNEYDSKWEFLSCKSIAESILSAHVDRSIRANPSDDNGITHFHIACMTKQTKAVEFFLNNGVDVNQSINLTSPIVPGFSPLHLAVKVCCEETAKKLLDHGADVHLRNAESHTPTHVLISRNLKIINMDPFKFDRFSREKYKINQRMIALLLSKSKNNNNNEGIQIITDEYGFSNFHAACTIDDISLAKSHLMRAEDVNQAISFNSPFCPGYSPLHFAAHFSLDIVKLLLAEGGNILAEDANGLTPLDICSQKYPVEDIVCILSTQPAWKDIVLSDNSTKLVDLLRAMENETAYRTLMDRIEDVNCHVNGDSPLWPGYTLLHFAVLFSGRPQAKVHRALNSNVDDRRREDAWPNLAMTQECIANGADFTIQDSRGMTPLHLAFYSQKESILKVFLDNGQNITNSVDENNLSHLHVACAKGMYGTARNLVLNGADVSLTTRSPTKPAKFFMTPGSTLLHLAVANGDVEIAKFLMQHGADLNATNGEGWSPLHCLMLLNCPKKIGKALFAFTAKLKEKVVESVGLSHLHVACHVDSLRGVKKLIRLGSNVDAIVDFDATQSTRKFRYASFTPLHFAIRNSSLKIATVLLDAGAGILARNAKGKSPLDEILVTNSKDKLINLFVARLRNSEDLQRRMNEDSGITLLHVFASKMDVKGVEEWLNSGADVNAKTKDDSTIWPGSTALHAWVYGTNRCNLKRENVKDTLKVLLGGGADVTLANAKMDTPLHCFVHSREPINDKITMSIGRLLLSSQKNFGVNPTNADGLSHFHISVRMCEVKIVEEYLKRGVNVDLRMRDFLNDSEEAGYTPLHLLIREGGWKYLDSLSEGMKTIDLLLKYGADTRAQDYFGDTPLHAVSQCQFRRIKLVEKIVKAGGMHHVANIAGETPFAALLKEDGVSKKEIQFFIRHGCRFNVFNAIDKTGLLTLPMRYCYNRRDEVYEMLAKSPQVMRVDDAGRTVLHNIVSRRDDDFVYNFGREDYVKMIDRFTDRGLNVDAQDYAGKTALHTASNFINEAGITGLLSSGADVNVVDKTKKSAFEYVLEACDKCDKSVYCYQHASAISAMWMHVRLMQLTGIDVSDDNEDLIEMLQEQNFMTKLSEDSVVILDRTKQILEQIDVVDSLRLYDFLSEMGAVVAYSTVSRAKRRAIDKYFTTKNEVLDQNYLAEVRGLLKLQYKKAVKRAALIPSACDSLRILSGIALPHLCHEHLMKYFSLLDIQRLISSTKD